MTFLPHSTFLPHDSSQVYKKHIIYLTKTYRPPKAPRPAKRKTQHCIYQYHVKQRNDRSVISMSELRIHDTCANRHRESSACKDRIVSASIPTASGHSIRTGPSIHPPPHSRHRDTSTTHHPASNSRPSARGHREPESRCGRWEWELECILSTVCLADGWLDLAVLPLTRSCLYLHLHPHSTSPHTLTSSPYTSLIMTPQCLPKAETRQREISSPRENRSIGMLYEGYTGTRSAARLSTLGVDWMVRMGMCDDDS